LKSAVRWSLSGTETDISQIRNESATHWTTRFGVLSENLRLSS